MVNILDYGAKPDTLCTEAVQKAIDAAYAAGGGQVLVPPGEYLCGTVELKSNITLYLENGAVLKGSSDLADYPEIGFHHNELGEVQSMLFARNAHSVRIEGGGVIDLNGESFHYMDRPKIPDSQKGRLSPEQEAECTRLYDRRVNQPIFFASCEDVKLAGIRVQDAPCWTITFADCRNIRIFDLTIDNSLVIPNNDGLHFCSCRDVIVSRCNISAGDDCIAITSITSWEKPSDGFVISDCVMTSCSAAIRMGYVHSIVRNVVVNNVIMKGCNRGFSLTASAGTGLIENVTVSNVTIDTYSRAGNWWGNGEPIVLVGAYHTSAGATDWPRVRRDTIRNVTFANVTCNTENAIGLVGEDGNITGITFENLTVRMKHGKNLAVKGRYVDIAPARQTETIPQDGKLYWLVLQNAGDVRFPGLRLYDLDGEMPQASVQNAEGICL